MLSLAGDCAGATAEEKLEYGYLHITLKSSIKGQVSNEAGAFYYLVLSHPNQCQRYPLVVVDYHDQPQERHFQASSKKSTLTHSTVSFRVVRSYLLSQPHFMEPAISRCPAVVQTFELVTAV